MKCNKSFLLISKLVFVLLFVPNNLFSQTDYYFSETSFLADKTIYFSDNSLLVDKSIHFANSPLYADITVYVCSSCYSYDFSSSTNSFLSTVSYHLKAREHHHK